FAAANVAAFVPGRASPRAALSPAWTLSSCMFPQLAAANIKAAPVSIVPTVCTRIGDLLFRFLARPRSRRERGVPVSPPEFQSRCRCEWQAGKVPECADRPTDREAAEISRVIRDAKSPLQCAFGRFNRFWDVPEMTSSDRAGPKTQTGRVA